MNKIRKARQIRLIIVWGKMRKAARIIITKEEANCLSVSLEVLLL